MTSNLPTLTAIFRDVFDCPDLELHPNTTAKDVPDWDSLMHIQIIVAVEKHYGIRFAPGEIDKLQNVSEFLELIAKKLARSAKDQEYL